MLREVYVVKNNTVSDIELKDFGIIIASGQTVELGEYDKAVMSNELYNLLISGDLVRYIDSIEVTDAQFLYSTSNSYYLAAEAYGNVIDVSKTGSTFTTINSALDAITDNNSDNRYLIQVSPDLFIENITMKPYVTIRGLSTYARVQGKITVDFTGSTNSIIIDNLEIENSEEETFYINTDGIIMFKDVTVKTNYTISSPNRVKSIFNIKRGVVDLIGSSTVIFNNTVTGTTNNIDTVYYVSGTGFTNLTSFNTIHKITTYEQNTYVTVIYNENRNISTSLSVKDSYVYYYLNNNNPLNKIVPILHSGATNTSSVSVTRFYVESPNNNYSNGVKFISVYNTNSYGVISNIYSNFNSFTWNNNHISDTSIFIAAATTVLDNVRVLNCFYKTLGDIIPERYDVDGNSGEIYYSITNNEGTQANFGQLRMSSLYIGTDISGSGGTVIDRILNENDFISDSQTGLATQHSIKEYVYSQVSGISTTTFATKAEFYAYTGTTGLQEITEINAETNIESSFSGGIVVERIRPSGDTTTAIQINKTDGVTPIINIDSVSGLTGFGTTFPRGLVHGYGTDTSETSLINTQDNALIIDGLPNVDKDVAWFENGIPKWLAETYRDEDSDFWYLYNVEADNSPITVMETGRIGINKQTNFVDYHPALVNDGGVDDLITGGIYTQNYNTVYELEISSTGVTDNYHWRTSSDNGITYGSWSVETGCSITEVELEFGVTVYFGSLSGHTVGQKWRFAGFSQIPQATFTIAPMNIKEVQKTEDFMGNPIIYKDFTSFSNGGLVGQTFTIFETGITGTEQALYLGFKVEINSIYIDLEQVGASIILITEFWDGTDWVALTFNNNYYVDGTDNLTKSGKIIWLPESMIGWSLLNIPNLPGEENTLLWIRFRTASNPTISPIAFSLSVGNDKRLSVYNSFNDYRPSFYIDARGRVNIGGGNVTGSNKLQVNTGNNVTVTATGTDSLVEFDSENSAVVDLKIKLSSDDTVGPGITFVKTRGTLDTSASTDYGDDIGHISFRGRAGTSGRLLAQMGAIFMGSGTTRYGDIYFKVASGSDPVEVVRMTSSGTTGFGITTASAVVHIKAGTSTIAPLKFTSGTLLSSPQVGAVEFLNDAWYGTITSGSVRKTFAFLESPQFTGTPNLPSGTTLNNDNLYNFIITSGGSNSTLFVLKGDYNTYTGTTAPNTYVSKSTYNTYTGTTGLNEITQINAYTGIETLFNSGISTTQIRARENNIINIKDYLGNTKITIKTDSGHTGYNIIDPLNQIHVYGTDTNNTDVLGLQMNGVTLDGDVGTDKQIQWKTRGTVKWLAETYRGENGRFWYLWSQENASAPIVASQGGRVGINNASNIMNYHVMKTVGVGEGLDVGGVYDKNFLLVYQIKINSTTGVTDTFIWRISKNFGDTFGDWSLESGITSSTITFQNGIELIFTQSTGNTLGDTWEFGAFPQLPLGTLVVTPVGFNEIQTTEDYTAGTVEYRDVTSFTQTPNVNYPVTLLNSGTTISAFYLGALVEFDSVFINLITGGTDITLIAEYWDGNTWTDMSIGTDYYLDNTNGLSISGDIIWDSTVLTGWQRAYLPNLIQPLYELFWIRIRSVSPPTIAPIANNFVRGGNKRFSVNTTPLSYRPDFYVDSLGRVSVGGGNIVGTNILQINKDYYVDVTGGQSNSLFEIDSSNSNAAGMRIRLSSNDTLSNGLTIAKTRGTLSEPLSVQTNDYIGHLKFRARVNVMGQYLAELISQYVGDGTTRYTDLIFRTASGSEPTEKVRISNNGTGFGVIVPDARIHIQSGSTTVAPLKFTSGSLLSSPQVGAVEFLTDSFYGTITSGTVRKTFAFLENPQFTGTPNLPSGSTLIGMNLYDFILTSGGSNSTQFVLKSDFIIYTGNTEITIGDIETDITNLSGWTGTKLDTTTFNSYTGSTIPWTQVSKSGSSISDLETRDAVDVDISLSHWVGVNNVDDYIQQNAKYTEDTQGSGRLSPETVLWGRLTNTLTVSGGTGYISYTNYHSEITWNTQTFNLSGYTEGTYYVYVDTDGNIQISTTNPDGIHNIRLGFVYWGGTLIGVIQQCGCVILNSLSRTINYMLRQGIFIYDDGGKINLLSGSTLKIISSPCKIQFGLLDTQLSEISSDDASTFKFSNFYKSSDLEWEINYYFGLVGQGEIPTNRWNDITKPAQSGITGTATFTNGNSLVTSTSDLTSYGLDDTFIYLSGDTDLYMTPVSSVTWTGSQTNITLKTPYQGTGGVGTIVANYSLPKMPNGKYGKNLIIRSSDDNMFFMFSQTYYDNIDDAVLGVLPSLPTSIQESSIRMAYIITTPGQTDLTDNIYDIRPLPYSYREGGQSGGGTTVTIHGDLTGLSADDHLQYLRTDGTRNLTGIQHYQSHPIFTADTDLIDKKYVDDGLLLKVNNSTYNTYTGTTVPNTYLTINDFNFYTGTTEPLIYEFRTEFNTYTGTTAPATYVNKTDFNTFTGTTLPNTYVNKNDFNTYTGDTTTALAGKQATITGGASTITSSNLTINRTLISDGSGKVAVSNTTSTELLYLSGVTSSIQPQLNLKSPLNSPTFTGIPAAPTASVNTSSTQIATTAFVLGQASSTNPLMNGSVSIGTSLRYSREDHVHPSDTSRLSVSNFDTFTGTTLPSLYVSLSTYNTFTGTTNTNISSLSGWTGTKLDTSIFNTYTTITAPSTFVSKSTYNTYTGNTLTLIGTKQDIITGAAITLTGDTLTINRALISNGSGNVIVSPTTSTQIGYLSGLTSDVQAQINLKSPLLSPTFTGTPSAPTASVNTNTTQIATTAYVVGQASSTNPLMNNTVAIGTSLRYSREDHVHPTDNSKLSLSGGTMTGILNGTSINLSGNLVVTGSTYLVETTSGTSSNFMVIDSITNKVGDSGLRYHVYGSEYQLASALASTSTNSTSPVAKVTMTTTDLPSGTYKIIVHWLWSRNTAANSARFDVTIGGVSQGTRATMEMEAGDTTDIRPETRIFYSALSGVNTILFRHWAESNANSTTTSDATIELIRVS